MKTEKFEATSVDAAIAKGLQTLRLSKEDVQVHVIQEPKKGFLGIGAKDAIVELYYDDTDFAAETEELLDFSKIAVRENEDDLSSTEKVEETTSEATDSTAEAVVEDENLTDIPVSEDEVGGPVVEQPVIDEVVTPTTNDNRPVIEETETATGTATEENLSVTDDSDQETEALVSDDFKDVEYVAEYLLDVLEAYLVDDATIEVEDRGRDINYNIQTEKKGLVIGKHGKIINSLETLAQVMTHQQVRHHARVTVNVGNYRERRRETLTRLARKTADQVAKTKQAVFLEPLPAAERKIIHAQLAKYSYVSTHSEGKEPHRYLVVDYKE